MKRKVPGRWQARSGRQPAIENGASQFLVEPAGQRGVGRPFMEGELQRADIFRHRFQILPIGTKTFRNMALLIIPIRIYSGFMKHRRQFLQAGLAGLALVVLDRSEAPAASGVNPIYQRELPPVSLNGWQVTVLELTFPPGTTSPKHAHPGFILGYILEGEYRFQLEGEQEKVLWTGDVFYEAPGSIHLPSGNASTTKPARILALAFAEKGKEITRLL